MGNVSPHASKEVCCPYPLTVTAMHCVLCGRPACYIEHGYIADHIWTQVRACHPDMATFPLALCQEHRRTLSEECSRNKNKDIIAVLKTGKAPSAMRGLDVTGIPKRAVPFGTLAVGACFYRLNRRGACFYSILAIVAVAVYSRRGLQAPRGHQQPIWVWG